MMSFTIMVWDQSGYPKSSGGEVFKSLQSEHQNSPISKKLVKFITRINSKLPFPEAFSEMTIHECVWNDIQTYDSAVVFGIAYSFESLAISKLSWEAKLLGLAIYDPPNESLYENQRIATRNFSRSIAIVGLFMFITLFACITYDYIFEERSFPSFFVTTPKEQTTPPNIGK